MVEVKCRDCEELKELGKDAFFCPLIINLAHKYNNVYGDYICKRCCRENYILNTFSYNTGGCATGSCHNCKFPIGAIEYTTFWFGDSAEQNEFTLRKVWKREKQEDGSWDFKESDDYRFDLSDYHSRYYALEWDNRRRCIVAKPKIIFDGVEELYFKHKKLPTRIILTFERTLSRLPLTWYEYVKYYWVDCGHPQHFNEEEWMDKAPVFILPMYYNKTHGSTIENHISCVKEEIEKNIKRKGSLYVLEQGDDEDGE